MTMISFCKLFVNGHNKHHQRRRHRKIRLLPMLSALLLRCASFISSSAFIFSQQDKVSWNDFDTTIVLQHFLMLMTLLLLVLQLERCDTLLLFVSLNASTWGIYKIYTLNKFSRCYCSYFLFFQSILFLNLN